jgi:hypothetical protein
LGRPGSATRIQELPSVLLMAEPRRGSTVRTRVSGRRDRTISTRGAWVPGRLRATWSCSTRICGWRSNSPAAEAGAEGPRAQPIAVAMSASATAELRHEPEGRGTPAVVRLIP